MPRFYLLIPVLLATLATPLRAQDEQATVEAIRSREASIIQAMTARDLATRGRRRSQDSYLAIFRQADPDTVLPGEAAAVHLGMGIKTVTRRDGSLTRFRQGWTDTWVKQEDGSWPPLASQWTDLPATQGSAARPAGVRVRPRGSRGARA